MPRLTPEQLEAQMHALLREQPLRRAPSSLENRVLAEIARRQTRPWWQKNYAEWPPIARALFLVASVSVLLGAALLATQGWGGTRLVATLELALQPVRDLVATCRAAGGVLLDVVKAWIPTISSGWLYAALGAAALGYATLIGLGATAYRFFWAPR